MSWEYLLLGFVLGFLLIVIPYFTKKKNPN